MFTKRFEKSFYSLSENVFKNYYKTMHVSWSIRENVFTNILKTLFITSPKTFLKTGIIGLINVFIKSFYSSFLKHS